MEHGGYDRQGVTQAPPSYPAIETDCGDKNLCLFMML